MVQFLWSLIILFKVAYHHMAVNYMLYVLQIFINLFAYNEGHPANIF